MEEVKTRWGVKYNIPKEEIEEYNDHYNPYTKERVRSIRRYCEYCKHSVSFISNHYQICSYCGHKVYPSKKAEFQDKMTIKLRKKENENK